MDSQPTFYRDAVNKQIFYPRHDRIWQAGGTVAKDFGSFVLKAETVYTNGRSFNLTTLADGDGLVQENTWDWVVGLDFNPTINTRVNTQFFQRIFVNHAPDTLFDKFESGFSLLVNHKFPHDLEAEALLIHSLNRNDWMLRPKVTWRFRQDWRLTVGLDVLHGPPTGLFGQYDSRDRGYARIRRRRPGYSYGRDEEREADPEQDPRNGPGEDDDGVFQNDHLHHPAPAVAQRPLSDNWHVGAAVVDQPREIQPTHHLFEPVHESHLLGQLRGIGNQYFSGLRAPCLKYRVLAIYRCPVREWMSTSIDPELLI
jgi:hypothetical protein